MQKLILRMSNYMRALASGGGFGTMCDVTFLVEAVCDVSF